MEVGTPVNPLRWGNPPVHIISHFNLITPGRVARFAGPGNHLSRGQILPCKRFEVG